MADTPVPDADPADLEEQHRPVVEEPAPREGDLPAVPEGDLADLDEQRQPATGAVPHRPERTSAPVDADPADVQEQRSLVAEDDDEDERR